MAHRRPPWEADRFWQVIKYGFVVTLPTLTIAWVYVWLRYHAFVAALPRLRGMNINHRVTGAADSLSRNDRRAHHPAAAVLRRPRFAVSAGTRAGAP